MKTKLSETAAKFLNLIEDNKATLEVSLNPGRALHSPEWWKDLLRKIMETADSVGLRRDIEGSAWDPHWTGIRNKSLLYHGSSDQIAEFNDYLNKDVSDLVKSKAITIKTRNSGKAGTEKKWVSVEALLEALKELYGAQFSKIKYPSWDSGLERDSSRWIRVLGRITSIASDEQLEAAAKSVLERLGDSPVSEVKVDPGYNYNWEDQDEFELLFHAR